MPGFNGFGPMGNGPMTGGARGYCHPAAAGYGSPVNYGRKMAHGRGFRGGPAFGRRRMDGYGRSAVQYPPVPFREPGDELEALRQQTESVKKTLETIQRKIAEMERPD